MSHLSAFLHPAQTAEVRSVLISDRFRDENGASVPFRIRAITQEENDALTQKCRRFRQDRGRREETLDVIQLNRELVVAATVEPDFTSAEVCEAFGTKIPTQVPGKMLLAGEYERLLKAIMDLSGFNEDLEDQAKN